MTIYSIILNYKTKAETLDCVSSIKKCHLPSSVHHKIIIVDNASNDGIQLALSSNHPDTCFLQTGANLGYTGGNNFAIRWILNLTKDDDAKKAAQTFIFIVNNDTTFDKHLFSELIKASARHPAFGILSPKIYFDPSTLPTNIKFANNSKHDKVDPTKVLWYAGGNFDLANMLGNHTGVDELDEGQYDTERQIDYASGCALYIPLPVMRQLKEFDNNLFMYFEDADLSFRAKKLGFELYYVPQAKLWHKNASSSKVGSPLQDYFTTRNRFYMAYKYHRLRTFFALIREALSHRHKYPHRFAGFIDFFLLKWGKGSIIKN